MEIHDPVPEQVLRVTEGRKTTVLRLTSRAECRALIRAVALASLALPEDGEPPLTLTGDQAAALDDEPKPMAAAEPEAAAGRELCSFHGGDDDQLAAGCEQCAEEEAALDAADDSPQMSREREVAASAPAPGRPTPLETAAGGGAVPATTAMAVAAPTPGTAPAEPEPGTQEYADKYASRMVQQELFGVDWAAPAAGLEPVTVNGRPYLRLADGPVDLVAAAVPMIPAAYHGLTVGPEVVR